MDETADLRDQLRAVVLGADAELHGRLTETHDAWRTLIARADTANRETTKILSETVMSSRASGLSWEAIGQELGMSRQAAQQRFGRSAGADAATDAPDRHRMTGLHAFNEMEELNRVGEYGWHSVGNGPLYHDLKRDDVQWEHRREVGFMRNQTQLRENGWEQAGTMWFPWVYWTRRTDRPAREGNPFNP